MKILIRAVRVLLMYAIFMYSAYHGLYALYLRALEGIHPSNIFAGLNAAFWLAIIFMVVISVIAYSLDHTIKVINKMLNN